MKTALLALLLLAAPALAGTPATRKSAMNSAQAEPRNAKVFCWYDDDGAFTSKQPAPAAKPLRQVILTGRGGKHAWAYTILPSDGDRCPDRVPSRSS